MDGTPYHISLPLLNLVIGTILEMIQDNSVFQTSDIVDRLAAKGVDVSPLTEPTVSKDRLS